MSPLPATCTAALFQGPGRPLELTQIPLPTPVAGEILVQVECCTLCGSDLHTFAGKRTEPSPSILGHEILGRVVSCGESAPADLTGAPLSPGDRITWSTAVSCGACDRCQRNLYPKCRKLAKYGHEQAVGRGALSGGLAEYVLLRPGTAIVRVAEHLPAPLMSSANCATATVAAALRKAGDLPGRSVLILGAGLLGLTAAAMASTRGAQLIVLADLAADRLQLATQFGTTHTVLVAETPAETLERCRQTCGEAEFDVILEMSGASSAVATAIAAAGVGGSVVLVGSVLPTPAVPLDPERVIRRWLNLHGVHNYCPEDLQVAVEFLTAHGSAFPFLELVTRHYPLRVINQAVEFAQRERPIRVAIYPHQLP